MIDTCQGRAKMLAIARNAANRDTAEADPVITAFASDKTCPQTVAAHPMVSQRNFQCGIDRFGAVITKKDPIQAFGCNGCQRARCFERLGMPHLEHRRKIHGCGLAPDCFDDFRMAVSGIDAPETGGTVENFPTVVRCVIHAGSRYQHARFRLELPIRREWHPEMFGVEGIGHVVTRPFG